MQRDYWAVIEHSACAPQQAMSKVLSKFPEFSPPELADFAGAGPLAQPLRVGDEMQILIKLSGLCEVRIAQVDERSLMMRTLEGHPEAGRITFGAYYDEQGQLIFRIRSRARASTSIQAIGYNLFGKAMQTQVWIIFIERLAAACGGTIRDGVQTAAKEIDGNVADTGELDTPTFVARDRNRPLDSRPQTRGIIPWLYGVLVAVGLNACSNPISRHSRLARLISARPGKDMTQEKGWTIDGSKAHIGTEAPGIPLPNGLFARAQQAMVNYDFSDPHIVIGHFDPQLPLQGRPMLLEIKVLGLHFLNGVRVAEIRDESAGDMTYFGYRYDTLCGHIERGSEWFTLTKDHQTGEVWFQIKAHWRTGQFPTWWSRVGFRVVGEAYRAYWRRRAATRLIQLAHQPVEKAVATPGHLAHRGDMTPQRTEPVPGAANAPS